MGRNKIKIERIENERIRQVTFYKRKKGLLKKAMELSLLCDVKVMLCVIDKTDKVMIYSSEKNSLSIVHNYILSPNIPSTDKEYLTNSDYKEIFIEQTKPESRFLDNNFLSNKSKEGNKKASLKDKKKDESQEFIEEEKELEKLPIERPKPGHIDIDNISVKEHSFYSIPSLNEKECFNFFMTSPLDTNLNLEESMRRAFGKDERRQFKNGNSDDNNKFAQLKANTDMVYAKLIENNGLMKKIYSKVSKSKYHVKKSLPEQLQTNALFLNSLMQNQLLLNNKRVREETTVTNNSTNNTNIITPLPVLNGQNIAFLVPQTTLGSNLNLIAVDKSQLGDIPLGQVPGIVNVIPAAAAPSVPSQQTPEK